MRDGKPLVKQPLCRAGSSTDNPCWREATELHFPGDEGPTLCAPHARLIRRGEESDAWLWALNEIDEWVRRSVTNAECERGHLERLALNMRDEARREYTRTATETRVAEIVAQHGPPKEGEPALTLEQHKLLPKLILRTDTFVDARTLVEDAPAEVLQR